MNSRELFSRQLKPYVGSFSLSIILNLISVILSIFSIFLIGDFLRLLFGVEMGLASPADSYNPSASVIGKVQDIFYHVVVASGKQEALLWLVGSILILYLFKNLFQYIAYYNIASVRTGIMQGFRKDLFNKIVTLPLSYFGNKRKGDIISRFSADVQEIDETLLKSIQQIINSALMVILYVITLFVISVPLTLFMFAVLPVAGYAISRLSRYLRHAAPHVQQKFGHLISITEESISGLKIIKSFTAIEFFNRRFQVADKSYTRIRTKVAQRMDLASPMSEFLGTIIVLCILIMGGHLIFNQHDSALSPTLFICYVVLFVQIINPAKELANGYSQIQKGKASLQRVKEILVADEVIVEKENPVSIVDFKEKIEFQNLSFAYDESNYVLKNIDIEIKKGSSIALVGPSGSGKSTLVDLIPRFYNSTQGQLLIDGIDVKEYSIKDVRSLIGIVSQETVLFNDTIFNNIAFGMQNAKKEDVIQAAKIANAHDFIMMQRKGYDTVIGDRGGRLSGGQRQRLSIARAVLRNPPILILDEATSALDTESEALVQEALKNLMQDRTSIIIAHRLSTIQHVDKIYVINKGEITEQGAHNQLLARKGEYYKFCTMQSIA